MTKELFNDRLKKLRSVAIDTRDNLKTDYKTKESIKTLLNILDKYNYENRVSLKGLLSNTIIDSLEIDSTIGAKFIEFDKSIG